MSGICTKSVIGLRIRDEREVWKLSQEQLAERISDIIKEKEVSSTSISAYERGASFPSLPTIVAMAKIFHVTTDYLLGVTTSKNPEAADTVLYTGLSEEAAAVLHTLREADIAMDELGTSLAHSRNKEKANHINVCDVISDFIICGSGCFNEATMLKNLSFHIQKEYKPFVAVSKQHSDVKLQRNAIVQAEKYFGPSEIVFGKRLLLYRLRCIVDHFQETLAKVCEIGPAIAHCEKEDAKQRMTETQIIKDLTTQKAGIGNGKKDK